MISQGSVSRTVAQLVEHEPRFGKDAVQPDRMNIFLKYLYLQQYLTQRSLFVYLIICLSLPCAAHIHQLPATYFRESWSTFLTWYITYSTLPRYKKGTKFDFYTILSTYESLPSIIIYYRYLVSAMTNKFTNTNSQLGKEMDNVIQFW